MQKTVHIIVTGKVQGVFYRQNTKEKAQELGLTGNVKNMQDGTVHITVTGETEKIKMLINWCKDGPPRADVADVFFEEKNFQEFDRFSISR